MYFLLASSNALAAMTIELYESASINKEGKQLVEMYIVGLGEGFFWANAAAGANGTPALYCPPQNLAMNGDNYISILKREIESGSHAKNSEVGLALLLGLQKTFPCE